MERPVWGPVEINYEDGIRRKVITENQVIIADSNISLDNIYKAIGYLTPEHQANILVNFRSAMKSEKE